MKKKNKALKIKNYNKPSAWRSALLLSLSLVLLICALILRFYSGFDENEQLDILTKAQLEKETNKEKNFSEFDDIEDISVFKTQVKPVSFTDVIMEQRNQDEAFQDVEYIAERKKAWTVQVMDVSKLDIIKDYLATHEKRSQFAYFRYKEGKDKRYILTFDDFNDEQGAQNAIENNEFNLPASVVPYPRPFKEYVGLVEQYHLENKVKEFRKSRYRHIKLQKTKAPTYYKITNSQNNKPVSNTKKYSKKSRKVSIQKKRKNENAFAKKNDDSRRYIKSKKSTELNQETIKANNQTVDKAIFESSTEVTEPKNSKAQTNDDIIENLIQEIQ